MSIKSRASLLIIVAIGCCLTGCKSRSNNELKNIFGSWDSVIEDENIKGFQVISFPNDTDFSEIKRINYMSSDSGFDFNIDCEIKTCGKWRLDDNTIMLNYSDSISVNPLRESFSIIPAESPDIIIPDSIKYEMAERICLFLKESFSSQFMDISGSYLPFATVKNITPSQLTLQHNGSVIRLNRHL